MDFVCPELPNQIDSVHRSRMKGAAYWEAILLRPVYITEKQFC